MKDFEQAVLSITDLRRSRLFMVISECVFTFQRIPAGARGRAALTLVIFVGFLRHLVWGVGRASIQGGSEEGRESN